MSSGPCGRFRFEVTPKIKVGLVTLQRKRPWPSCINPGTGNQWSEDMKCEIVKMINKTPFEITFADENLTVADDSSIRLAVGKNIGLGNLKEKSTFSISRIFFCKKLISRKKYF